MTQGDALVEDPTLVDKSPFRDFSGDLDSLDEMLMSISRTPPRLDEDGLSDGSIGGVASTVGTFALELGNLSSMLVKTSTLTLLWLSAWRPIVRVSSCHKKW